MYWYYSMPWKSGPFHNVNFIIITYLFIKVFFIFIESLRKNSKLIFVFNSSKNNK